jgi:mRNA interferase MazF
VGLPAIGDVVVIDFPFADQKARKRRPAVVVALSSLDTVILCQVTSRRLSDVPTVKLTPVNFKVGKLQLISYARPDKLVTVDAKLAQDAIAKLNTETISKIHARIRTIFKL